jgi:putative DNA primase/helicase
MVGPENCSAVSFNELERHFQRASLYGKVLNVSTEVGADALQSNYFKAIVTGDPIDASYKFRDSFTFTPFVKLIFATNIMPRVKDTSDGYYRRILPVLFKKQFKGADDDKDLEYKLEDELSGIFEWALIGLDRLRMQKEFTWCDETENELHGYMRLNSPVLYFAEEMLEIDPEASEVKDDLYKRYRDWADDAGVRKYGKINFFRELKNCISSLENIRPRTDSGRQNKVKGVRYVGDIV